ncbi:MAG: DUF4340 domain-containing protein [Treponema sp.]|nr:DUF4340 domain-containing protein [Treponema sp.]
MTFKKRLIILLSMIAVLALTYTVSIIVSAGLGETSSYAWLDSRSASRANKITVNAEGNEFELVKRSNQWFVLHDGLEFPARQMRVEDFLTIFTTKSSWPVRSSGTSSHERFGIGQGAGNVAIYSDNNKLLDLLVGYDDVFRNETYFRKAHLNEVRSGSITIKTYITNAVNNWYNLRLISETESGNMDIDVIQKLTVNMPHETQVFARRNRGWEISGINVENPSRNSIEGYIRGILNMEGDSFEDSVSRTDPIFDQINMVLEFGNGRIVTIRYSEPDENGRCFAHVSGKEYIYSIPAWSANRLYRTASSFEMQ